MYVALVIANSSLKESAAFDLGDMAIKNELNPLQNALLELVIPRTVYKNAIKGMLSVLKVSHLSKPFLRILISVSSLWMHSNSLVKMSRLASTKFILGTYFPHSENGLTRFSISSDFSTPDAAAFLAKRHLRTIASSDPTYPSQLKLCIQDFENGLTTFKSSEFCILYCNFVSSLLETCEEPNLVRL